ncbi:MAG: LysE family transporter [Candidatus Tectomicrobia bacterium]|uniref:LysE family transporter n=1 Tax=Tectimicrobiota bacterium TaxID=2528274 RepID=A0A932HW44_UNCTE|nr:LysE family transporter [Candidatus Tectomicrobia bacterium]
MDWLAFLGVVAGVSLTGVMSPGPLSALILARGRQSPWAGLWANAGHALAEAPLILLLWGGLQPLLEASGARRGVSLLGGLFLLWMGAGMIRARPAGPAEQAANSGQRATLIAGAAMTAFNPYWLLWWLTVGTALIARARALGGAGALAAMIALHLVCDFAWGAFLSGMAHRGGGALGPGGWRWIEWGCGAAVLGFGGFFLWEGMRGGM